LALAGLAWQNECDFMMNQTNGWMGGWSGGGMWIWAVIGVAVVVLLVVVIAKVSRK
jgi:anti-sigma-K factor RskA